MHYRYRRLRIDGAFVGVVYEAEEDSEVCMVPRRIILEYRGRPRNVKPGVALDTLQPEDIDPRSLVESRKNVKVTIDQEILETEDLPEGYDIDTARKRLVIWNRLLER